MSGPTQLPPTIERFLASADGAVRALHERLAAMGMAGTYAKYLDGAGPEVLATFFEEVARVDLERLARHRQSLLAGPPCLRPEDLSPLQPDKVSEEERGRYFEVGQRSLAAGEWATLVLAGGASTRFYAEAHTHEKARELVARMGFHPPKGLFPVTPVAGRSFMELFVSETLASGVETGRLPYLLLLASDVTGPAIRAWRASANLWGFPRELVLVLDQAVHPRLDCEGDLVVGPDGRLLWTGDGHGGAFRALLKPVGKEGSLADLLREHGVRGVVLHNVDNAAARALEPTRIGFHVARGARMTLSVVPRARVDEKVGVVVFNQSARRIEVLEYSVCPRTLAEAVGPDGRPLFWLAHICTNLVSLDAIRADLPATLYTGKKVQVRGRMVETSTFEMLNQHLAGLLDPKDVRVLLLARDEYFLPTKTLVGPDSHEATVAALAALGRRRLREAGARVPESAVVELAPCLSDLARAGVGPGWVVGREASVFLGVRHGLGGAPPFSEGLVVGDRASLRVEAERPYGVLRVDGRTRCVREDPESAGRLRLGRGVRVEADAALDVVLVGNGSLVVEDGARVAGPVRARIPEGESWTLAVDGTLRRE